MAVVNDTLGRVSKRKLIFVWNYTNWGGAQIYLIGIMKYAKDDWDVLAVLPVGSSRELLGFIQQEGIPYELIDAEVDMEAAPTLRRKLERQKRRILAEIRTFRFLSKFDLRSSVLHMEFSPWQSWILYSALCRRGANIFVTMHNALPNRPIWRVAVWKARLRFLSGFPSFHIFASNHDTRNKLKGWVRDAFWQKIKVTYTCVDPYQIRQAKAMPFDKRKVRRKFRISNEKCIVLCLAQFIDRKGRWTFLEAAKIVTDSNSDIDFVWVAPELPDAETNETISSYGLGDRFRIIKSSEAGATRIEILSFFRVGDIFVLPSFLEGLPISLLEAMAMGLPAISTDVNAIPEVIKDDQTGVLIPPGCPEMLAREIVALAADPARRDRLARAGQEYVLRNFDERVASGIAVDEYKECFEAPENQK